jgi:uncharacterized membrane protein
VGYALTGSVTIAGALTLVEPLANTVAHYFFDRWWTRREAARAVTSRRGGMVKPGQPGQGFAPVAAAHLG